MKPYNVFYFILFFTWSSVYTLITVYMNEVVGLSLSHIGIIMSVLPLISMVFQPIWGGLSDYTGRPRTILQILIVVNAIIAACITWFTKDTTVILIYFLFQVFICGQNPLTDTLAIGYVNSTPNHSFGFIRTWGSIGYGFGAFLVAQVANVWGLKWIFYIAGVGFLTSFVLSFSLKSTDQVLGKSNYKKDIGTLLKQKSYLFVLLYGFLLLGTFFGSDQYLGLYIRSHDIDVSKLGIITFIAVCVEVPFIFNSKKLIQRMGAIKLLIFMNLVAILRMILLGLSSTFFMFAVAAVLRGIVVGIFIPVFIEIICDITPKAVVTSAVSIYSAISSGIANFVFTLIGGLVADYLGYNMLYFGFGLLMVIPLMLAIRFNKMALDG